MEIEGHERGNENERAGGLYKRERDSAGFGQNRPMAKGHQNSTPMVTQRAGEKVMTMARKRNAAPISIPAFAPFYVDLQCLQELDNHAGAGNGKRNKS